MSIDKLQMDALPAMDKLLQMDPDALYEELGVRRAAIGDTPMVAGQFDPTIDRAILKDLPESLHEFGKHFFKNLSKAAYAFLCGDSDEDKEERQKVFDALGLSETAVAAAIAGVLVSSLGIAPAIAAVVAALLFKLVFKVAGAAACEVWKDKLPD